MWRSVSKRLGAYRAQWNAFIKLDRRLDLPLIAGLPRFHHGEERLRQGLGSDVLSLAVRLDQCGEPEVGCRTDRGHNGRAFRCRCSCRRQAGARCGAKSKCDNREKACPAQDLRVDCGDLAVELSPLPDDACGSPADRGVDSMRAWTYIMLVPPGKEEHRAASYGSRCDHAVPQPEPILTQERTMGSRNTWTAAPVPAAMSPASTRSSMSRNP